MEWPKLKNMILALLLITNLALLSIVLSQEVQEDGQEQQARTTALDFLSDRGIVFQEEQIPTQIPLPAQELAWDRSQEEAQATQLLGAVSQESLGGDILRYHSPQGELRFYTNGEYSGSFDPQLFPCGDQDIPSHGLDFLGQLDIQGDFLYQQNQGGQTVAVFQQSLDQIPLIDCLSTLIYQGGSLVEIAQSRRVQGSLSPQPQAPITVATALMTFYAQLQVLGDVCSEIVAIQPCYWVTSSLTAPGLLTPSWHILTDTGGYYLNNITGELIRD